MRISNNYLRHTEEINGNKIRQCVFLAGRWLRALREKHQEARLVSWCQQQQQSTATESCLRKMRASATFSMVFWTTIKEHFFLQIFEWWILDIRPSIRRASIHSFVVELCCCCCCWRLSRSAPSKDQRPLNFECIS